LWSKGEADKEWQSEYVEGNGFEMYHVALRPEFKDVAFVEASEIIYDTTGMLLIALEIQHPDEEQPRIILNPGSMAIPDIGMCFGWMDGWMDVFM
jgi:hypothetical protein